MKTISTLMFMLLVFSLLLVSACGNDSSMEPNDGNGDGDGLESTLSSIQSNIFTPKCVNAGCHPGNGAPMSLQSGTSFASLVNQASSYNILRVDPGNPDDSALYLKVTGDSRTGARMPLGGTPLTQEEQEAIQTWIANGAEDN